MVDRDLETVLAQHQKDKKLENIFGELWCELQGFSPKECSYFAAKTNLVWRDILRG